MIARPVRLLLIGSLALNILLGAALLTALALAHLDGGRIVHAPDLPSPRALARHLSDDERDRLHAILQTQRAGFRAHAREVLGARQAVHAALVAEPFDAERFAAALAELHGRQARLGSEAQQALVDLASSLDADGRRRLAKALLRPDRGPGARARRPSERD
jgi:uncharacterized membrane protein